MQNKCKCPLDVLMTKGCPSNKGKSCPFIKKPIIKSIKYVASPELLDSFYDEYCTSSLWDDITEEIDINNIDKISNKN